jgi:hypothetical protein
MSLSRTLALLPSLLETMTELWTNEEHTGPRPSVYQRLRASHSHYIYTCTSNGLSDLFFSKQPFRKHLSVPRIPTIPHSYLDGSHAFMLFRGSYPTLYPVTEIEFWMFLSSEMEGKDGTYV